MTLRRFHWLLRAYGAGLAAWPAAERAAALALVRRSGQARQLLAEALAEEDAPAADPLALCRMQRGLGQLFLSLPPATPAVRWGALVVCAAAGLYLGAVGVDAEQPDLFAAVQAVAIDAAP